MEEYETIKMMKAIEDRTNIIENSYGNSFLEIPVNRLQSRLISDVSDIGLEYLLNYQTIRLGDIINISTYGNTLFSHINNSERFKDDMTDSIKLNEQEDLSEFERLLYKRRSVRNYLNEQMSFDIFSKILIHSQNMRNINGAFFKNTPSGGGLYPIDLYLYTNHVENVDKDIFILQSLSNSIHRI